MNTNSPQARKHYRNAQRAIQRLASSSRPDQTALTILKNLRAAAQADGE